MKAFNKDKKSNGNRDESRATIGGYEQMIKDREKQLPSIEASIQEALDDYEGQMVVVITVKEDENGDPVGSNTFIGGVSTFESSIRMLDYLEQTKKQLIKSMTKSVTDNPDMLKGMIKEIMKRMEE